MSIIALDLGTTGNRAIAYTKKEWWEYALNEAKTSFEILASKDTRELISLIEQKIALSNNS